MRFILVRFPTFSWLTFPVLLACMAVPSIHAVFGQAIELRVADEVAPAGGIALILVELTEPEPISGGKTKLKYGPRGKSQSAVRLLANDGILGEALKVDVLSSLESVSGNVVIGADNVLIEMNAPAAAYGTEGDLPILAFAIPVSPTALPGESLNLELDLGESQFFDAAGKRYQIGLKQGTFTVGGTCITEMTPNRGIVGAGVPISFHGAGFQSGADLKIEGAEVDTVEVLSGGEIRVTLERSFEIRSTTRVRLRNPDKSEELFYPINDRPTQVGPRDEVQFLEEHGTVIRGSAEDLMLRVDARSTSQVKLNVSDPAILEVRSQIEVGGESVVPVRVLGLNIGTVQLTAQLGSSETAIQLQVLEGRVFQIPLLNHDASFRVGVAISNASTESAAVRPRKYPSDGENSGLIERTLNLMPLQQDARFLDEFEPLFSQLDGWLEVASTNREIHSQFINVPNRLIRYPGSVGVRKGSAQYLLPLSNFDPNGVHQLVLVNSSLDTAKVTLDWHSAEGTVQRSSTLMLPSQGSLAVTLHELFGLAPHDIAGSYIRVNATKPLGGYHQMSSLPLVYGAEPESLPLEGPTAYLPQFAVGDDWETLITLINLSGETRTLSLRLSREGLPDLLSSPVTVTPGELKALPASQLFAVEPESLTVGSLVIPNSRDLGISALFGKAVGNGVATVLPVSRAPIRDAVFSQVANGSLGQVDLFTGVAIQNPGTESAQVMIKVYGADGTLKGDRIVQVEPGARIARLLSELVEGLGPQFGGQLRCRSDQPIMLVQIIGDSGLSFLSTVEASISPLDLLPQAD